ncbi:MAG: ABC transporter substrate-binding protein [Chloroflexota bacterium]
MISKFKNLIPILGINFKLSLMMIVIGAFLSACYPSQPENLAGTEVVLGPVSEPTENVAGTAMVEDSVSIPPRIVFWSLEIQQDRVEITNQIIQRFTEKTGIEVDLVLLEENAIDSLMRASYEKRYLPDVVYLPLEFVNSWEEHGILDADAAASIINNLDASTFAPGSLAMVGVKGDQFNSVPSDGWGQLLIYRADIFESLGLEKPDDLNRIRAAAQVLTDAGYIGLIAGTNPNEVYTQQTFEHFALAHGVQIICDNGEIFLNTPEMIAALDYYTELMRDFGPGDSPAAWFEAREQYFAGHAGMIIWSPFILDEMAGLRDDFMPDCLECETDPGYLAEISGIVPAFVAVDGTATQWGAVNYFGITTRAKTDPAVEFVEFMMSEGYLDWLSMAPEGKMPMRYGTSQNPSFFLDQWRKLPIGVDRKLPISEIYNQEILETLVAGSQDFQRWGFIPNSKHRELVGILYSELIIPGLIADIIDGKITPQAAAKNLETQVKQLLLLRE